MSIAQLHSVLFALVLPLAASPWVDPAGTAVTPSAPAAFADGHEEHLFAIEKFANDRSEAALQAFLESHLAPEYVQSTPREQLVGLLRTIRARCGNAGGILLEPMGDHGARMTFEAASGRWDVLVTFESAPPQRITELSIVAAAPLDELPAFTWDNVESRLAEYEREGFSGSVLLVRDGSVVLHRGYGFADPDGRVAVDTDTIFAIGSVPIDFTKAAILLLEQRGDLKLSDRVSAYVSNVPTDKATMTLEHLMSGRSGLANFHGLRDVDADLDLTYIDRAEALRRIFAKPLLFAPGTDYAHSHSAWGVLAAVVEVVSGQDYGTFLAEQLFGPAGMERTGLYEDIGEVPTNEIAVGHGTRFGKPNAPQNWGPTSWLVMGSGGMVSTTVDLHRWLKAMHTGKLLTPGALTNFWTGGILAGDNERGFLCVYTEGPDTFSILCSNAHAGPHDLATQIGGRLAELALDSSRPAFTIGIAVEFLADRAAVRQVDPGSPAKLAGLRIGDEVVGIDGDASPERMRARIEAAARTGKRLVLTVERDGDSLDFSVAPRKRD